MQTIISKFGGTSVSSLKTWRNILTISQNHLANGLKPILVCSARSHASNLLESMIQQALHSEDNSAFEEFLNLHQALLQELELPNAIIEDDLKNLEKWLMGISLIKQAPAQTQAQILSVGELISTKIGRAFLEQAGLRCLWYDARLAIKTTAHSSDEWANYCQARCQAQVNPELQALFQDPNYDLVITQGFIASNQKNETVLLGRGGSDTSAALFAAIIEASQCEIWTDVPGIYTANPHHLPQARLLKQLNYDEAQEIASQGAKVLHPLAISPVRDAQIPMAIKYTWQPEHPGTLICLDSDIQAPPVKSIQIKNSISLIAIETSGMWQQAGFLADVFKIFAQHQFSINLISTAECQVTLSLDGQIHDRDKLHALIQDLNQISHAKLIEPCTSLCIIGHHIRRILPELGSTFELFHDQQVHLISLASNDLSLNIVVDESKAERIHQQLHQLLIDNNPQSYYYSKSWQEEFNPSPETAKPWWVLHRKNLIHFAEKHAPCYAYYPQVLSDNIEKLKKMDSLDGVFYAVKANYNHDLLRIIEAQGLNFECVSQAEIEHILKLFPNIHKKRILFTPNFAERNEYIYALAQDVHITIDSLYPLMQWGDLFKSKSIFLRIDPGSGAGFSKYVSTTGDESKFGLNPQDIETAKHYCHLHQIQVCGLHAHAGSGILSAQLWLETAELLLQFQADFPHAQIINLGGGLGISERPGQQDLDLNQMNLGLLAIKQKHPGLKFWLEPGRFIVAECGVLLSKATQEKTKNNVRFIGLDVGMNSLIRPALYGSYHHISNLSKFDEPQKSLAHVVGPICESADTLGYDRMLPHTDEHDIFLIANTGAYGFCMGSQYNLRQIAPEYIFED